LSSYPKIRRSSRGILNGPADQRVRIRVGSVKKRPRVRRRANVERAVVAGPTTRIPIPTLIGGPIRNARSIPIRTGGTRRRTIRQRPVAHAHRNRSVERRRRA